MKNYYENYKNSVIKGMGKIPAHWSISKLKNIATIQLSNVDKKEKEGEKKVNLCNYTDVFYNEIIHADMDFLSATASDAQIKKFELRNEDVIITKDSESWHDIAVPAYAPNKLPGVVCGYHLALIRPNKNKVFGSFLFRTLQSSGVKEQFMVSANGITRYGLGKHSISVANIPIPTYVEQFACPVPRSVDRINAR